MMGGGSKHRAIEPAAGRRVELQLGDGYVAVTPKPPLILLEIGWPDEAMCAVELERDDAARLGDLLHAVGLVF